jgi:type IV secretory pathway protease TraF
VGGVFLLVALGTCCVRLNVSPSVPLGLYWLRAVPDVVAVGTLVVLPVPASMRPWHSRWVPLLKPIAGVAGDEICLYAGMLIVEREFYGLVYPEAGGHPLPQGMKEKPV